MYVYTSGTNLVLNWYKTEQTEKNRGKQRKAMFQSSSDEVLTTNEAIRYLRISKPTFLKWVHLGKINAVKIGNGWRVLKSELDDLLSGKKTG